MPFAVPLEVLVDQEGTTWRGYFRVDKGRAGAIIVREFAGNSGTIVEAANRIVLKLAMGEKLSPQELIGLKLLQGILLMSGRNPHMQRLGAKEFNGAIREYLRLEMMESDLAKPEVQKAALQRLGLSG